MTLPLNQLVRNEALALQTRRHFLTGVPLVWEQFGLRLNQHRLVKQFPLQLSRRHDSMHFPAKVKRVIFLHMLGAPSQLELFDYKPILQKYDGKECPQSYLEGERFAFIQGVPRMLGPQYPFKQHGQSGAWVSDRLPHFSEVVDKVSFIKTLQTDQFNHGPAELMVHCGQARIGYPSIGSWVTWDLERRMKICLASSFCYREVVRLGWQCHP